jgi:dipeptidyl aminopeptidase/acylaminoacyl peptidase
MAYNSSVPEKSNTIVRRDFVSGADLILDEAGRQPGKGGETIISPDGSKAVFERDCKSGQWVDGDPMPCTFMIPATGGELKQLCEFCTPRGFSSNGSVLLIQKYTGREDFKPPDWISVVDLGSGTEKKFLSTPHQALYHAFFSWDDRWVVFKREDKQRPTAQILIAPVRNSTAGKEAEWIPITDGRSYDDKPQFSSDGNTVYFISTRDGYLCIWAQRLNPMTKRPAGEPQAYEHFHYNSLMYRGDVANFSNSDLSVARDKMVINLALEGHDIRMTRIQ